MLQRERDITANGGDTESGHCNPNQHHKMAEMGMQMNESPDDPQGWEIASTVFACPGGGYAGEQNSPGTASLF